MINHPVNLRATNPEVCACCCKPIRAGHPFITCHKCNSIIHKKCRTADNIRKFRDQTYCKVCTDLYDIIRYNPFYQPLNYSENELVEEDPIYYIQSLQTASSILECCKNLSISQFNSDTSFKNLDHTFSTCFMNIDGNSTNFDDFVIQMQSINHKFSVVGLAETNTDSENGNLYQINDYSSCYQSRYFCKIKKRPKHKGSGLCLYVHNSMNFTKMDKLSICNESIESLFVTITNATDPLVVGVVYRPPNSTLADFNFQYEKILSELDGKKCYILGDFNVDLLQNSFSLDQDRFQEIIYTNGFTPSISLPTHQMPHCAKTCIDNIHTNDIVDCMPISGVLSNRISHHHMIYLIKELTVDNSGQTCANVKKKVTTHYNYSNSNLDKLCEEIEKDIDRMHSECDTFESFLEFFQEKIDTTCKLLTPRTSKRNSIVNPWITEGLINSIEKKARLYFDWRKTCSLTLPDGNDSLHVKYKEFSKVLKNLIKVAKTVYYSNKFEKYNKNSKKTWEIINELRGKTKMLVKDDFIIDGQRIANRRIIANKFNEYFTSLASNLNEQILSNDYVTIDPINSFVQYLSTSVNSSIFLEDTTPLEIVEIITNLKNGKASDIPIIVLKRPAKLLSTILAQLYNNCMQSGIFPSIFKVGKVTPIHKKDNKALIENYRPVSILPIFGKIFERIIYNRLYKFLTSKGVLQDEQFGFRKGHSTSHALHKSVHSISNSLANGKHVLGVFIDLSKAFDTLDHGILLHKLYTYGIRGTAHSLLKSYLSDRKQVVVFNGTTSDLHNIQYGVPQGSILGPLLFLLYINDLTNSHPDLDTKFVLYADDTNIFISGPSKEKTFIKANMVLEKVSKYMKCNLLHINMSKCCFIHFRPTRETDETCARTRPFAHQNDISRAIFINGMKIEKVSSAKFLGVVIDEKLNWDQHVQYLLKKLRSITGALCRIRKSIPNNLYLKLYSALFESHLTYGISVWGVSLKDNENDKLFVTQKQCIRVLFGDLDKYLDKQSTCARTRPFGEQKLGQTYYQKEHTKPIFNRLKLLTVQNLFKYYCISELYKIIKFRCPYTIYNCIKVSPRESSLNIILPVKSNTFLYRASTFWNSIHKQILSSTHGLRTSMNLIKLRTKTTILETQSKDDADLWSPNNFNLCPTVHRKTLMHSLSEEVEIINVVV